LIKLYKLEVHLNNVQSNQEILTIRNELIS